MENNQYLSSRYCHQLYPFYCSPETRYPNKHYQPTNWSTAQNICQEHGGELSTVTNITFDTYNMIGWVGLHKDPYGIWRWTDEPSNFFNWERGEPIDTDCGVSEVGHKGWFGIGCHRSCHFVCYGDNLVMVREQRTWEEARQHCLDLGVEYDLLSSQYDHKHASRQVQEAVTNEKKTWEEARTHCQNEYIDLITLSPENEKIITSLVNESMAPLKGGQVWIGLNRDPANKRQWTWTETRDPLPNLKCEISSVTNSTFEYNMTWIGLHRDPDGIWRWTDEPSNSFNWGEGQPTETDCGSFIVGHKGWFGFPCALRLGFVCYGDNLVMVREQRTWEEARQHCLDLGVEYDLLSSQYGHKYASRQVQEAVTNEVCI
ncbi:hypothetical protein NHX12_001522 [Muraenolepis orangiensis]|uniref:C-type lectin domain-containing protein n=1 Tax=Muraenolepis orangiensis TaxID=630683 RepID=A0A9Q0E4Q0_9TELE|nr:hypothetical protein NHX12_001522 [Muraenolepis orangiensis]